ncbi:hypothetical protein RJ640_027833 [Escallonia rubra]|uniref:Reverse transcriptase Ty1/copia-type domain-containing protein n=1 Tax=Escallonia rubra TaxID=112253 RepID=A0AA88RMB5_9ASTE|nr:hypothetical protein RJ640_027833 [Escallonia rubra]
MSKNFDMKDLGEASYVIGIEIHRDRSRGILGLSQNAYIDKVLKRFNMHKCAPTIAPVVNGDKCSLLQCPRNQLEQDEMELIPYASAIGSLVYAQALAEKLASSFVSSSVVYVLMSSEPEAH